MRRKLMVIKITSTTPPANCRIISSPLGAYSGFCDGKHAAPIYFSLRIALRWIWNSASAYWSPSRLFLNTFGSKFLIMIIITHATISGKLFQPVWPLLRCDRSPLLPLPFSIVDHGRSRIPDLQMSLFHILMASWREINKNMIFCVGRPPLSFPEDDVMGPLGLDTEAVPKLMFVLHTFRWKVISLSTLQ